MYSQTAQYPYIDLFSGMNINQLLGLCIMAGMAVFVFKVTAISVTPAAIAQNMTGGNMTGQISGRFH